MIRLAAFLCCTLSLLLAACQPAPEANVLGYLLGQRLDSLRSPSLEGPPGTIEGRILAGGEPLPGATVLVAERTGQPHVAITGEDGRYRIAGLPADGYTVAAVAPGYVEAALHNLWGGPVTTQVRSGETATAPDLHLMPLTPNDPTLFDALALQLQQTGSFTATAPFPLDAAAQVRSFSFVRDGVTVDTLRLYLPLDAGPEDSFPLVLFVAPTAIDDWQQVSVAFASQGYALAALSPVAARGVDADAQAQDAAAALTLAQAGALGPEVGNNRPVAIGGSYSSAILARLVRAAGGGLGGWVSVGGLANAFDGAAAFYAGELEMPLNFEFLVLACPTSTRSPYCATRPYTWLLNCRPRC
jgi:hypothetical protein